MNLIWSTIMNIPMLTKYSSRKLKEFESSVIQFKYDRNREMEALISQFKLSIPD
jgi:hypothetical protein